MNPPAPASSPTRPRLPAWCAHLFTSGALVLTALLVHSACRPDPSALIVRLGKPKVVILAAVLLALAGGLVRAQRRGAIKLFVQRVLLLGLSLGLSLLPAEVAMRLFLRHRQGEGGLAQLEKWTAGGDLRAHSFTPLLAVSELSADHRLLYDLKPNLTMEFGHRSLHTNSRNMRESREYDPSDTNTLRIVGIGDSGMFGWGVNQDEDYLSVLESNLNATALSPRYEVLNFGVPGYNTGQELEMLRTRALAYRPRVVILGWCDNDYDPPFLVTAKREFNDRKTSYLYRFVFYRRELLTAQVLKPSEIDRNLIDPTLLEYVGEPGVRQAMAELRDLSRRQNFRLLVFGNMNAIAVRICKDLGIDFFNTRERVDASRYPSDYAVHFMHPAAGGHRVLAEHLQAELQQRGWLN